MALIVPVKFTFTPGELWFDPDGCDVRPGDRVVCATERGTEVGLATAAPREVTEEELSETIGDATLKPIERVATEEDLDRCEELAERGDEALPVFRRLVKEQELPIKPVGVEYLFGGERVVCYFAAEERVDFRQLVRDLSRELHERIDMRQIGVREEAALMGGYAHCGQELCCTRWEQRFDPVSIRMAKEQDLPLNSPKISGVCGRLMCCLRYEFEAYRDFKGRAPKKNAKIKTPLGDAKITGYNTPREMLDLRLQDGKRLRVPLEGMECSPEACKKAEDNHCPCRPDTVTRSMLEALESPDVQMALAELDRENGIVPEPDESDLVFVSEGRRKRRRKQVEEQKEEAAEREAQRRRAEERRAAREAAGKPNGPARRKRRHHAADEGEGAPAQGTQPAKRKRTHQAADGDAQPKQGAQRQQAKRKPGDKGGAPQKQKPAPKHAAPAPKDGETGAAEGAKPKRRRRRGGRGRGKGSGGNGAPASNE